MHADAVSVLHVLPIDLLKTCCPCFAVLAHFTAIYLLFLNPGSCSGSTLTCRGCGSVPASPPRLLFASWRSLCGTLDRDTLREMGTCVATETSCDRRSFSILFLAADLPSPPPLTLAASWSIKLLPATPRRPPISTAKGVSLWRHSSKDKYPRRA